VTYCPLEDNNKNSKIIGVAWRVTYRWQELHTLHGYLVSLPVVGGVRVVYIFLVLGIVLFVLFVFILYLACPILKHYKNNSLFEL
jgi:hypothetical protein